MYPNSDTLDSRALRCTDCYGQRFMREGTFHYHVMPSGGQNVNLDRPHIINVSERKRSGKMTQHSVALQWEDHEFMPGDKEIDVEVGDLVVWNCSDRNAPPYEIVGEKEFFASARMVNECGFSHAFGVPGTYEWGDAHGSDVGGIVRVEELACESRSDLSHWRAQLSKAALVMIADGTAKPAEVHIVVGQTVYFAIVTSTGMTITDKRLIGIGTVCPPRTSKPASKRKKGRSAA
jgi:plastocyanin